MNIPVKTEVNLEARLAVAQRILEAAHAPVCPFLGVLSAETRADLEVQFQDSDPHRLSSLELAALATRHGVDAAVDIERLENAGLRMDAPTEFPRGEPRVRPVQRIADNTSQTNEMHSIFDEIPFVLEEVSP
jgi:hypothetical protein